MSKTPGAPLRIAPFPAYILGMTRILSLALALLLPLPASAQGTAEAAPSEAQEAAVDPEAATGGQEPAEDEGLEMPAEAVAP